MKLSQIKENPENPRLIKDAKFEKLCKSIKDFPEMLKLRPIIVDENNIALGGNMRLKALQHLGYSEVPNEWVEKVTGLTEEQKKEFIIKDNIGYGEWDWEDLANNWDIQDLSDWGLDIPNFENPEPKEQEAKEEEYKFFLIKCPKDRKSEFLEKVSGIDYIHITESNG